MESVHRDFAHPSRYEHRKCLCRFCTDGVARRSKKRPRERDGFPQRKIEDQLATGLCVEPQSMHTFTSPVPSGGTIDTMRRH